MPFIVIEVTTPGALPTQVKAFGPYATRTEAEQARHRRNLDNVLADQWSPPRTYVAEIEGKI